jgi:site-specific DNA-methyltransferase (adenine-specific)
MIESEKFYKINKNTSGKTNGEKEGKKWSGEYIESNKRFPNSVIQISNPSRECGLHPTQKPLALCEYLIKTYTNENDLVLDNCSGSGSTLVAAKNLNRRFIGIEKEEKYYNICLERLK